MLRADDWRWRSGACIEKKLANFLGGGRASGFASDDDRKVLGAEFGGQLFQLRTFAAAIEAFEGDKNSARVTGHGKIIASGVKMDRSRAIADQCFS